MVDFLTLLECELVMFSITCRCCCVLSWRCIFMACRSTSWRYYGFDGIEWGINFQVACTDHLTSICNSVLLLLTMAACFSVSVLIVPSTTAFCKRLCSWLVCVLSPQYFQWACSSSSWCPSWWAPGCPPREWPRNTCCCPFHSWNMYSYCSYVHTGFIWTPYFTWKSVFWAHSWRCLVW